MLGYSFLCTYLDDKSNAIPTKTSVQKSTGKNDILSTVYTCKHA